MVVKDQHQPSRICFVSVHGIYTVSTRWMSWTFIEQNIHQILQLIDVPMNIEGIFKHHRPETIPHIDQLIVARSDGKICNIQRSSKPCHPWMALCMCKSTMALCMRKSTDMHVAINTYRQLGMAPHGAPRGAILSHCVPPAVLRSSLKPPKSINSARAILEQSDAVPFAFIQHHGH